MIEKKIHYCWFGKSDYSPMIKKCMQSWHEYLPDWEFILWDETNSPVDHPFVKKALKDKKYAFAADYIRCYALYREGGIYLDTDMEVIRDLSPLLSYDFFSGYEDVVEDYISAGIIGVSKENEIMLKMIQHYDNNLDYLPIPKILTKIYSEVNVKQNHKIFKSEYFYPYNPFDINQKVKQLFYADITHNTYAIHHWNFSWKPAFMERFFIFIKKKLKF